MNRNVFYSLIGVVIVGLGVGGFFVVCSMYGYGIGFYVYDEVNMLGFCGENVFVEESVELVIFFCNFEIIICEVENLLNGIRMVI